MAIEIEGLAELSTLLTKLPAAAARRYLSKVAIPAAEVVLDALAQTVPVDIGILEEGLGWQRKWGTDEESDETSMTILIGPLKPYFYGSFQEWGTFDQPAQHWMGRAWDVCQNECLNVFATEATGLLLDLQNGK